MYTKSLRGMSTASSLTGAMALAGCGVAGPATLTVPTGMSASTAAGVKVESTEDTIASLLPDPGREFAPVSARSRTDEFHITAISSDDNNGFHMSYMVAGQERTVHFEADDYGTPEYSDETYTKTEDGGEFWLDAPLGSFANENENQGSPYIEYHDLYSTRDIIAGLNNRPI